MGLTDPASVEQAYAAYEAAAAAIAALDYAGLPIEVLLELQSRRETLKCAAEAVDHQILAAAQTQATAKDIGAKDWPEVLHIRHRISWEEARRRVRDCDHLGPRSAITGEPLGPVWELVAAAQADGVINIEHIAVITGFFAKVPLWVDPVTLVQCERDLVAAARYKTPEELRKAAADLLYRLDQDGPEPDDDEPDPQRSFVMGKQQADGRSEVKASLDPEARAYWEALFEKLAAPGMCNPDDPEPCISGTPTQAQIAGDTRTVAQRQYDAFKAVGRMMLASGQLGEHSGLPVSVVATTTVQELERGAGVAVTHTGSKLPVRDLIRMAGQGAYHYLAVFDQHTTIPLYLGRARRTATTGQRIMLFARDRGCTKPNCTAPASRCQAHHVDTDWGDDGPTDITNLALACGCDNRAAHAGGWSTTMKNGRAHWTPPPLLDIGQPRTNQYHHPTLYPPESEDGEGEDGDGESDSPAS
ncbi:HNH endonuclease signature motif containing protein [Mycolicibacterium sp. HS_4_1]